MLPSYVTVAQVSARESNGAEVARERGLFPRPDMEGRMPLEVLMPGEAGLTNEALERLIALGVRAGGNKRHCRGEEGQRGLARQRVYLSVFL